MPQNSFLSTNTLSNGRYRVPRKEITNCIATGNYISEISIAGAIIGNVLEEANDAIQKLYESTSGGSVSSDAYGDVRVRDLRQ